MVKKWQMQQLLENKTVHEVELATGQICPSFRSQSSEQFPLFNIFWAIED